MTIPVRPLRLLAPLIVLVASLTGPGPSRVFATVAVRQSAPSVAGTVRDTEGRPLPNVTVLVSALRRGTTTNDEGVFVLRGLTAGTYELTATLIGHVPAHVEIVVPRTGVVRPTLTLEISPLALAAVQVTAAATSSNPLDVTQATVELSGNALERNLRPTIAQTLANEPGLAVRYYGPAATHPVIRGLTGERVLVLQDGQRTGDLASASTDHSLSIDPLTAQRVEVVRGPASLLYGSNALGGVVNVISGDIPTSIPAHVEGSIAMQAESVHPGGGLAASASAPVGDRIVVTLRGGGRRGDDVETGGKGVLENSDFRNLHGVAGIGFSGKRVTGGVAYRAYRSEYGLPAAPGEVGEAGMRVEGLRHEVTARTDAPLSPSGITRVRVDANAHWYAQDEIEPDGATGTSYGLHSQNLDVNAATRVGRITGALGVSGLFRQYEAFGEEALTPGATSTGVGVFVFQDAPLFRASSPGVRTSRLQLGARYDRFRITPHPGADGRFVASRAREFDHVSGSVGVLLPLGAAASLGLSASRAFRAPTVEELFSDAYHPAVGSYDIGDPDLQAETSQGLESVLRGQSRTTNAQVAAFYNRVAGFVTPTLAGDTAILDDQGGESITIPIARYTQGDVVLRGVEGQVERMLGDTYVLGLMGDVVRGDYRKGGPLPFMPAARLGGSVRWDDRRHSVGFEVRHAFAQDRVQANELATAAYTLLHVNAGFSWKAGGRVHSVTLRAENLLDEEYRDAASRIKAFAPNPGRNLSMGYRLVF